MTSKLTALLLTALTITAGACATHTGQQQEQNKAQQQNDQHATYTNHQANADHQRCATATAGTDWHCHTERDNHGNPIDVIAYPPCPTTGPRPACRQTPNNATPGHNADTTGTITPHDQTTHPNH